MTGAFEVYFWCKALLLLIEPIQVLLKTEEKLSESCQPVTSCVLQFSGNTCPSKTYKRRIWINILLQFRFHLACDVYTTSDVGFEYTRIETSPSMRNIRFAVKANYDVYIGLDSDADFDNPLYEIVIGGWYNGQSAIRRCKQVSSNTDCQ